MRREDFGHLARFWQKHRNKIGKVFGSDLFINKLSPEPFNVEEFIFVAFKSYPQLEKLTKAIMQIRETGILKLYADGYQTPAWAFINPHKWSKESYNI